ncbi:COP1-interactive protein 1-like [Miscanthus floridulus]|uniref:COP1-interactive protein 1-like n=1 Tax=Miscanthus floridulus TaxID=154761 RepID=UPI003458243B
MESDLAQTKAKLKEALEQVELVHQAVSVDLPRIMEELEVTLIHKSRFLREEHGQMEQEVAMLRRVNELECQLESTYRESQDRIAEVLGVEESNTRLLEKVTQQEEGLSIPESTRLELGGKNDSLERELETAKTVIGRSTEALAQSLEEGHALKGELDQFRNVAQVVVSVVFGSAPSTSTSTVQLAEALNEVWELISDGMFYVTSGVLTSVVMHHLDLDFAAISRGYANS